jgi:hypothetical protein
MAFSPSIKDPYDSLSISSTQVITVLLLPHLESRAYFVCLFTAFKASLNADKKNVTEELPVYSVLNTGRRFRCLVNDLHQSTTAKRNLMPLFYLHSLVTNIAIDRTILLSYNRCIFFCFHKFSPYL